MIIENTSPVPLYYQLREQFRSKILDGEMKYGDKLPSETELCKELSLSRSTVKQAYDGLVADGLIRRTQGKGTFVDYNHLNYDILQEPNFYARKDKDGSKQWSLVLEAKNIKCNELIAKKLKINIGDEVCYFKRVRYIDDVPSIIQTVYIVKEFSKSILNENLANLSFHKFIEEENNIKLNCLTIRINSIILDNYERELFNINQLRPGFLFDTIYNYNDKPIIFNERIFRGDHITLLLEYNANELNKFSKYYNMIKEL